MTLAVIRTGGKQYLVSPGQKIKIEKIKEKPGEKVEFLEVLLLQKGKKIMVGTPLVKGAKVKAKVVAQAREKKVIVFKHKAKKRYNIKKSHRQPFSEVVIESIDV